MRDRAIVSRVYVAGNSAWQLPLSAGLLWFASNIRSGPGHFIGMTTALRVPVGTKVGNYLPQLAVPDKCLLFCCDHEADELVGASASV